MPIDQAEPIDIFFDIDGTLIPEPPTGTGSALSNFSSSFSRSFLPGQWKGYADDNVVEWQYGGITYKELLLPGLLEMLQLFIVHFPNEVRLNFFSAGSKKRNESFCAALMHKVAQKLGVSFADIRYMVYSRDRLTHHKKKLSALLPDIANAILVDDRYSVVVEATHLLKAVGCNFFSGYCFAYQESAPTREEKIERNLEFLDGTSFYDSNQIYYITGLLLATIKGTLESRQSSSKDTPLTAPQVLNTFQTCSATKWFKHAASCNPMAYRYPLEFFLEGFKALLAINRKIRLFMPFDEFAKDAILQKKVGIDDFIQLDLMLKQSIKPGHYDNHNVIDTIHEYNNSCILHDHDLRLNFFGSSLLKNKTSLDDVRPKAGN